MAGVFYEDAQTRFGDVLRKLGKQQKAELLTSYHRYGTQLCKGKPSQPEKGTKNDLAPRTATQAVVGKRSLRNLRSIRLGCSYLGYPARSSATHAR
jgi:hypothetical protein